MKKLVRTSVLIVMIVSTMFMGGCDFLNNFMSCVAPRKSDDILPHLISESQVEASPVRAIKSKEVMAMPTDKTSYISQMQSLYDIVVVDKKQPDLSAEFVLEETRNTYLGALAILDRYMLNSFTPIERVHAIHDYLTYYVDYDMELYNRYLAGEPMTGNESAFNLSGAILGKVAVCDGFSKAFGLLCGIEGINSTRITGFFKGDNQSEARHAWNKVYLQDSWYNIDTTQDACYVIDTADKSKIKMIHHGYFLVSDDSIRNVIFGKHKFDDTSELDYNPDAIKDYPFHAETDGIKIDEKQYKMRVTSLDEVDAIFKYIRKSYRKIGKIELQFDLADTPVTSYQSLDNVMRKAYDNVKDKDFVFLPEDNKRPYYMYPNGVVMALIYK